MLILLSGVVVRASHQKPGRHYVLFPVENSLLHALVKERLVGLFHAWRRAGEVTPELSMGPFHRPRPNPTHCR